MEIDAGPVTALHEFIAFRGLEAVVRPHYGVDQADGSACGESLTRSSTALRSTS